MHSMAYLNLDCSLFFFFVSISSRFNSVLLDLLIALLFKINNYKSGANTFCNKLSSLGL